MTAQAVTADSWQFRGTPNDWGTTPMTAANATTFTTCQTFVGVADPRFKIDHLGDWTESYPAQDRRVAGGSYQVAFDVTSWQITTQLVSSCAGAADSWLFRGTPNDWGTTPMTASSATTFTTCQTFAGVASPRFKIDHLGDWTESYPAQDFAVTNGSYQIGFDAVSRQVTAQSVASCGGGGDGRATSATT